LIKVSLEGKKSNRQGIGALVRVSAAGRTYLQVVGSQGSYLSQHATPLHLDWGARLPSIGSRCMAKRPSSIR